MRTPFAVFIMFAGAGLLAPGCLSASSDSLPHAAVHVRGTVQSVTGLMLTVKTESGAKYVQLVPPFHVSMIVASDRGHLNDGSYIGIRSVTERDGSLRALEVHIFPEGVRRTGEGSYAWDLSNLDEAGPKMANGTILHGAARTTPPGFRTDNGNDANSRMIGSFEGRQNGGSSLTLQFKSTSMTSPQSLTIPWGVPIVKFVPGGTQDLKPGAHVLVIANQKATGELTAARILIGKNGLVPSL